MPLGLVSTRKLVDKKVFGGKDHAKHLGKVKCFVFHPNQKRCVGFVIKRPDVALMFHRDDLFVAFDSFKIEDDGDIFVPDCEGTTGGKACERLGIDFNTCVVWRGLPVVTESGETLGIVGDVLYDGQTGEVQTIKVDANASANALLGRKSISTELIYGFRVGIGKPLISTDKAAYGDEVAEVCGGILVSNEARDIVTEGLADKAGRKAGEVSVKAKTVVAQSKPKAQEFASTAKEAASKGAKTAGVAINKGAQVASKKLEETRSMFSAFKEEFDKGLAGESSAPQTSERPAADATGATKKVVPRVSATPAAAATAATAVASPETPSTTGAPDACYDGEITQSTAGATAGAKPRKVKKVRVERL